MCVMCSTYVSGACRKRSLFCYGQGAEHRQAAKGLRSAQICDTRRHDTGGREHSKHQGRRSQRRPKQAPTSPTSLPAMSCRTLPPGRSAPEASSESEAMNWVCN